LEKELQKREEAFKNLEIKRLQELEHKEGAIKKREKELKDKITRCEERTKLYAAEQEELMKKIKKLKDELEKEQLNQKV